MIEIVKLRSVPTETKMLQEVITKYYQSIITDAKRLSWRITELVAFNHFLFKHCPPILASHPIKIPSGRYEEKLQPERTQADWVKEMEQELSSLPRFVAWTKTLDEDGGVQKAKVKTVYVGKRWEKNDNADEDMQMILDHTREYFCTPRDQIEKEIAERYAKWRKVAGKLPPTWIPA